MTNSGHDDGLDASGNRTGQTKHYYSISITNETTEGAAALEAIPGAFGQGGYYAGADGGIGDGELTASISICPSGNK